MRTFILLAICCISFSVQAQAAYRWVDSNGVVHYSDRPHEGAEVIELDQSSASRNLPVVQDAPSDATTRPGAVSPVSATQPAVPEGYRELRIVSPQQGETLWNLGATLTVNLEFSPALETNHRIRLVYDGERRTDLPADTATITLDEVYRGAHTLKAQIEDIDGNVLIESSTKRFFVQQNVIRR